MNLKQARSALDTFLDTVLPQFSKLSDILSVAEAQCFEGDHVVLVGWGVAISCWMSS